MFIIDIVIPIVLVSIFILLHERWKKEISIPVPMHILIVSCRMMFSIFVVILTLLIFAHWLKATELQLVPILAITIGSSIAIGNYYSDQIYEKYK